MVGIVYGALTLSLIVYLATNEPEDALVGAAIVGPPLVVSGAFIWVSTSSDYVRVMDQRLCQWLLCQANSYPVR